jgi:hypothetical protein
MVYPEGTPSEQENKNIILSALTVSKRIFCKIFKKQYNFYFYRNI